ncbi:hypothetical protein ACFW1F_21995 [Streptomyces bungoensis]|uniref:hypothetical protein n=1 Tax=Streptomyces bungoensis TaxID=285568 RepID=UPI0034280938
MTEQPPPRALRWALRLHPAAYRTEHGPELTAIYAEATRDAGPLGRLREALDVAAHGLRQRTGLSSDRTAGRVLAQAAPLTVAVATASSVANVLWLLDPAVRNPNWSSSLPDVLLLADQGLVPLFWLAALTAVWAGRWSAARALVVPATVLRLADLPLLLLAHFFHATYAVAAVNLIVPLLTGALVLAAPRDLLGSSRPQRAALAGTTALAAALWTVQLADIHYTLAGGPGVAPTLWVAVFAVALLLSGRDRLPAAALAVALLPVALQKTVWVLNPLSPAGVGAVLVVLLSGAFTLVRARRHRGRVSPPSAA